MTTNLNKSIGQQQQNSFVPTTFNELTLSNGSCRPSWPSVFAYFNNLSSDGLANSRDQALRLIQKNGVTYNIYGDPEGLYRPWEMDLVPHIIDNEEWNLLENGLAQRAHLLDLLMRDVYGPLNVLKHNLLPPEIIYGHPGYLRSCHGFSLPHQQHLHFYAADLGRSPDGSFWVIGDRTQAPFGAGYALENRIVLSRVLDPLFRSVYVHRIAGTFHKLKNTLVRMALTNRNNPRIVLLTPGPTSPFYFEHSYLARYLGYSLVHGEDLAFRNNHIFLKTLSGLKPIDVIFRFMNDEDTDPLELARESTSGIAGLVQAVRAGNVVVANSLGTGLLESPALMAFLPSLCRYFLGEELKINSVATWWCGQAKERNYVLANLSNLIIKPVVPESGVTSIYTHELLPNELDALKNKILQAPHLYVGQEKIHLSTTPIIADGHIEMRSLCLRSFAVAHENSFSVMPGGLTRVASSPNSFIVSDQQGAKSKDTWIVSPIPVPTPTLLRSTDESEVTIIRSGGDVASRVADNLFWLGRYTERVENLCRLLRALLLSRYDNTQPDIEDNPLFQSYLHVAKAPLQLIETITQPLVTKSANIESQKIRSLLEAGNIFSLLASLYRVAHCVRDRLSDDVWMIFNQINQICQNLQQTKDFTLDQTLTTLDTLILNLVASDGLASQGMSRGQGWRFLDKGRRVERALQISETMLQVLVKPTIDETSLLETIMDINLSLSTYRRRYLSRISATLMLDLMFFDERNPRSLAHQVVKLQAHVAKLPEEHKRPWQTQEGKIILETLSTIRLSDPRTLAQVDAGRRKELETFLIRFNGLLHEFVNTLTNNYFSHTRFSQQA